MNRAVIAETLRRHFVSPVYLSISVVVILIAAISGAMDGEASGWHAFGSLLVIGVGSQLIGPEFSSGTLQLIVAKPVNRAVYLISRYLGVVLAAAAVFAVATIFDLGGRLLIYDGAPSWRPMLHTTAGEVIHALVACALLALFGALTRSYWNVAIYFVLNLGLAALVGGLRAIVGGIGKPLAWLRTLLTEHPAIIGGIDAFRRNLFPEVPETFDSRWALMVVSNAGVVLLLACFVFRRREVPYGAD